MSYLKLLPLLLIFLTGGFAFFIGCGDDGTVSNSSVPTVSYGATPTKGPVSIITLTPFAQTGTAIGYVLSRTDGGPDINNGLAAFQISHSPSLPNYAPVKNAVVSLRNDPYIKAVTDATGRFEIHNVPYSQIGDLTTITVVGDTQNIVSTSLYVPIEFTVIVNPTSSALNARETKIHPESGTLYTGQAYQFKVYCRDDRNNLINPSQYKWSCSSSVGTIDQDGILQVGNQTGSGIVTVTVGDKEVTIVVSVVDRPATGTISGQISYSDGSPGKDVKISVQGSLIEVTPDSGGQYTLPQVPPGKQTVTITYNGQAVWTGEIEVALSGNTNLNVPLQFDPLPPSIIKLNPPAGVGGTPVTITGSHFGASQGKSTVTFNGKTATVKNWSNTSILAEVPKGATDGDVVVNVNNVASNNMAFYMFGFRYIGFISNRSGTDKVYLYDIATLSLINLPFTYTASWATDVDISSNAGYIIYKIFVNIFPGYHNELYLYNRNTSSNEDISGLNPEMSGLYSINSDGDYIAFEDFSGAVHNIGLYNKSSNSSLPLPNINPLNSQDNSPSLSPDARYIAFYSGRPVPGGYQQGFNIYLYDRQNSSLIDITALNSFKHDINPSISSDAAYIAFESERSLNTTIYLYERSSGSLIALPGLSDPIASDHDPCISNDGNFIAFTSDRSRYTNSDIYIYNRKSSSFITLPDLNSSFDEKSPALSD